MRDKRWSEIGLWVGVKSPMKKVADGKSERWVSQIFGTDDRKLNLKQEAVGGAVGF